MPGKVGRPSHEQEIRRLKEQVDSLQEIAMKHEQKIREYERLFDATAIAVGCTPQWLRDEAGKANERSANT